MWFCVCRIILTMVLITVANGQDFTSPNLHREPKSPLVTYYGLPYGAAIEEDAE
jgi:hypothetical protein